MSCARRTKLSAMYSSSCCTANAMSSRSFAVIEGADTCTPGRLIPLWLESWPPWTTRAVTRGLLDVQHDELDQSVVDEDPVAVADVVGQRLVRDGDLGAVFLPLGRKHDVAPVGQVARSPQLTDADPRTLEVAEDGDRPLRLGGDVANERDRRRVLFVRAM